MNFCRAVRFSVCRFCFSFYYYYFFIFLFLQLFIQKLKVGGLKIRKDSFEGAEENLVVNNYNNKVFLCRDALADCCPLDIRCS